MATAVAPDDRIESIDVVRGVALFGVLIVNLITGFRVSIFQQFSGTTSAEANADHVVERIVSLAFEFKAICLFALLFGLGLAIQFDRLGQHGRPLYWLFCRLPGVLAFCLIHLLVIWDGDILTGNALAGLIGLPLLLLPPRELLAAVTGLSVILGIVGGAALTAADAHGFLTRLGASGAFLRALTPVLLALGYGAALIALMQLSAARRLLSIFAPVGRMAFTNYVLQSVIFGFIFFGYGLGQFGRMGAAMAFVLGVAVYIAQLVLSKWWLRRYRFGPIEWLWRTLMYGAAQPMRKAARNAA